MALKAAEGIKRTKANQSELKATKDKDKDKGLNTTANAVVCPPEAGRGGDFQTVINAWNSLGLNPIRGIAANSTRQKLLSGRLNQDGLSAVLEAVENVRSSSFLNGQNKTGFSATFDWFVKPSNFQKVLDGNYSDRRGVPDQPTSTADRLSQMIKDGVFDD